MPPYIMNVLIAIDQFANVLLRGEPDETLSSRAHRMRLKGQPIWGWTARAINLVFFLQADHCLEAFEAEQRRRQLPQALQS